MNSFKDLEVWQDSIELVVEIYKKTRSYPSNEKFNLVSQMRRSAVSIPSNIAEGQARRGKKEFVQFLKVAYASCAELETQCIISDRLGLIKKQDAENAIEQIISIKKRLNRLMTVISSNNQ